LQRGEAGAPAPEPLVVWVSDGGNPVAGVDVTFRVIEGGGTIDGEEEVVVPSDATGHASVRLTLGPGAGNNVVEVNYAGNLTAPVRFTVNGTERRENLPTTF